MSAHLHYPFTDCNNPTSDAYTGHTSNSHTLDDDDAEEEDLNKMSKGLCMVRQHAWKRWENEYVHSLMESHRINRKTAAVPDVGEVVLVIGDEKNRGEWRKAKVMSHIRGKDGVVRGVKMLHKGHHIERPLQLVCSLELKGPVESDEESHPKTTSSEDRKDKKTKRRAAEDARAKIRQIAEEEEIDI